MVNLVYILLISLLTFLAIQIGERNIKVVSCSKLVWLSKYIKVGGLSKFVMGMYKLGFFEKNYINEINKVTVYSLWAVMVKGFFI